MNQIDALGEKNNQVKKSETSEAPFGMSPDGPKIWTERILCHFCILLTQYTRQENNTALD